MNSGPAYFGIPVPLLALFWTFNYPDEVLYPDEALYPDEELLDDDE